MRSLRESWKRKKSTVYSIRFQNVKMLNQFQYTSPRSKKLEIRDIALFSGRGIKNSFLPSLPPSIFPNEKNSAYPPYVPSTSQWRWISEKGGKKKKNFILPFLKRIPNTRFPLFHFEAIRLVTTTSRWDSTRNAIRIFFNPLRARRVN